MKLPYGYVLINGEIVAHEETADVVRSIFEYYLAGASLGKIVDMLHAKGIPSPSGNSKWGRVMVDKLLSNTKYIPIIGVETYMDAQFERERRCNVDYDKTGHPRKTARYQSPYLAPPGPGFNCMIPTSPACPTASMSNWPRVSQSATVRARG